MIPLKLGRRECEVCERRLANVRIEDGVLVGDCAEDGTGPAWITGVRQNRINELEDRLIRATGPATSWLEVRA